MVFTSIPAYLDSANWQQQQNHQIGSSSTNSLLPPAPQPAQPLPPQLPHATGGSGSIRLGSMAERARLASIPMPEGALRCPRCESTNTKFCYFNNYNLSQPRHFCKSCRRYWTRGGALRTVPVGGGCRRNKRSKGNNTKSPVNTDGQITTSTSTSTNTITSNDGITTNTLGLTPQIPPLRFMSPLSRFTDNYSTGDINLNYSGYAASVLGTNDTNFSVESNLLGGHSGGGMTSILSSGGIEQWRLQQQFPSLGGLDPSPAWLHQFQGGMEQSGFFGEHTMRPKLSTSMTTQLASVKLEENPRLNSSRQFMEDDQWSTGAAWTDLSSFSSTSTRNPF